MLRPQTDQSHQLIKTFFDFFLFHICMNSQGLRYNSADSHSGIQGAEGILKNQLYIFPKSTELLPAKGLNVNPVNYHAAGIRFNETEHGPCCGCFPRSAFTDHPKGMPLFNSEVYTIKGPDNSRFFKKILLP